MIRPLLFIFTDLISKMNKCFRSTTSPSLPRTHYRDNTCHKTWDCPRGGRRDCPPWPPVTMTRVTWRATVTAGTGTAEILATTGPSVPGATRSWAARTSTWRCPRPTCCIRPTSSTLAPATPPPTPVAATTAVTQPVLAYNLVISLKNLNISFNAFLATLLLFGLRER